MTAMAGEVQSRSADAHKFASGALDKGELQLREEMLDWYQLRLQPNSVPEDEDGDRTAGLRMQRQTWRRREAEVDHQGRKAGSMKDRTGVYHSPKHKKAMEKQNPGLESTGEGFEEVTHGT